MVRQWEGEPSVDHGELTESTLAKAARELRLAERRKPADPRPNVYLAEVYDRLERDGLEPGQPQGVQLHRLD